MIEFENITKEYVVGNQRVIALDSVSFQIKRGDYVAIMGQSGSGKSTSLNILGCLMQPNSGKYILNGDEITKYKLAHLSQIRKKYLGFIFQSFNLISHLSILDNIALPLIYNKEKKAIFKKKVEDLCKELEIESRLKHMPGEISGGQRQRVAIARALINEPEVLIADEPTGNLDSKTEQEILRIFEKLNKQGKTIIIVTHSPMVAAHAKRVLVLRNGKKTADFNYEDMRENLC